jgi:hypothetical protein
MNFCNIVILLRGLIMLYEYLISFISYYGLVLLHSEM